MAGAPPDPWSRHVLQPLRVPGGWVIGWNTLYASSSAENGDFGGSSLFSAIHEGRRFWIDVEFRPEFDPNGQFCLTVLYQPWPRTERGRRRMSERLKFGLDAEQVHLFETRCFQELIAQLELWIARCTIWVREPN